MRGLRSFDRHTAAAAVLLATAVGAACTAHGNTDPAAGAPPPAVVDREGENGIVRVDRPEQFPIVAATGHDAASELTVTGVVSPDVSRAVPVVSLASGRVLEIRARLGDQVQKGELLLRIQSADVASAFSDYRKAVADRALADSQLDRANALFERGAIAKKDLEVAQDTSEKARVDVDNSTERLRVLGADPNHPPSPIVDVVAPASGVITEQNVTNASGVKSLDNSPNLFTISDLSRVWIVCDVYENDLRTVKVGDPADIHLAAYPDRVLKGRIDNIGAMLDPTLRTAKVRIEVANPNLLRIGMFVTATFRGLSTETRAVVPAAAVLHLHDRDWVYVPAARPGVFERREVAGGPMLAGNMQELRSGLKPGDRVVANALVLQSSVEQ
ncbi:MAG TPA: efflux RND transporter periplasmic adaptor subunit [Vicinamibacterales bacterium]|nr:efflux RND transporter periplasmic adaptor subunit [Vicinamibacterales bacterium]